MLDVGNPPAQVAKDDLGAMANNQQLAEWLYKAIRSGAAAYEKVPPLVEQITSGGKWMHRYAMHHRQEFHMKPEEFLRFVQAPQPEGLDATPEQVKVFLKDPRLLDLWDELTVRRPGSNGVSNNPSGKARDTGDEPNRDIVTVSPEPERGNCRQFAIRKLRNDAPEIHARVLAGELSPHAGMVEAGFRPKLITIPADPEKAARRITLHFSREQFRELVEHAYAEYERKDNVQPRKDQP